MSSTQYTAADSPVELDLKRLLKRAWVLYTAEPAIHIIAALLILATSIVTFGLLTGPLLAAYLRLIRHQDAYGSAPIDRLWRDMRDFWPAMGTWMATALAVVIGTLFLVLPGMIVMVLWGFGLWFVALGGASPSQALLASMDLGRHQLANVVVVVLASTILTILGTMSVVGYVAGFPLAVIFSTLAFLQLIDR